MFDFQIGGSQVTLQFSGNAPTRTASAILLLSSQTITYPLITVMFRGDGSTQDVSEKESVVSTNSLKITGSTNGQITIPAFGDGWGRYRIIIFDNNLSVSIVD